MENSVKKNEFPLGVILAILGGGVFVTIFLVNYPDESSDAWAAWAAWVQAFGSISAIMAAYFLGERQAVRSERLQRSLVEEQIRQKRTAIYAIAQSALDLVKHVREIFTPKDNWTDVRDYHYDDAMIDSQIAALNAVPVHEIGSAIAVREFLSINQKLTELKHCANHWKAARINKSLDDHDKTFIFNEMLDLMGYVTQNLTDKVERIRAAMYPDVPTENGNTSTK